MHSQKGYIPSLLHNFGTQATAPLHFNTKQWLMTGAAIGFTAVLFTLDGTIDTWAKPLKQEHPWIKVSSPVVTEFGNRYGAALVVAIGSVSAVIEKEKGVQTSLLATQAIITSGAWVRVIKLMTGRERPKGAYIYSHDEDGKWYGPFAQFNKSSANMKAIFAYDAFPSGHTAVAFAIATVFATQYNDSKLVPVFCYSAATIVGVTRLIEHEHWASDVFVGGLIGYLCGRQVVKHFNEIHPDQNHPSVSKHPKKTELSFIQNGNQIGISLKW
jgi:membrane-associated phospholipid phosphatase